MPKIPFNELSLRLPQKRYKQKNHRTMAHTGIDTETYEGKAVLICDDSGRFLELSTFDDVISFLTHSRFRDKFNWFFNIRFDFEALIKHLPYDKIKDLYFDKRIQYNNYTLKYLPSKFISFSDDKYSYIFYDLNNFLETSLNNAAKTYLKNEKISTIDVKRLNTDKQYWKDNQLEIIEYCIHDAFLTKELAIYFWNLIDKNLHFIPRKPYSKGSYSQEYFLHNCYIPTINNIPTKVIEIAYNSYSGGRFELLQRGFFKEAYSYDIKSAYPYHMTNLIDYNNGEWRKTREFDDDTTGGFYKVNINLFHENFSPIMKKISSLNIYPNGSLTQYLTHNELLFILKNFKEIDISIKEGYIFREYKLQYPLREKITELYHWKEREEDRDIKYAVKIVLNSLYGKFIQTAGNKTGKLFNPLWAAEITANTRIQLLEQALKIPKHVIGFSTDAIHTTKELPHIPKRNDLLGDFVLDFSGSGIFIMSDIYTMWNENKVKNKFRGFKKPSNNKEDLSVKDIIHSLAKNGNGVEYRYDTYRPIHLGEIIFHTHKKSIKDLNVWQKQKKKLNLNGDLKRVWDANFETAAEALKNNIQSLPLLIY